MGKGFCFWGGVWFLGVGGGVVWGFFLGWGGVLCFGWWVVWWVWGFGGFLSIEKAGSVQEKKREKKREKILNLPRWGRLITLEKKLEFTQGPKIGTSQGKKWK